MCRQRTHLSHCEYPIAVCVRAGSHRGDKCCVRRFARAIHLLVLSSRVTIGLRPQQEHASAPHALLSRLVWQHLPATRNAKLAWLFAVQEMDGSTSCMGSQSAKGLCFIEGEVAVIVWAMSHCHRCVLPASREAGRSTECAQSSRRRAFSARSALPESALRARAVHLRAQFTMGGILSWYHSWYNRTPAAQRLALYCLRLPFFRLQRACCLGPRGCNCGTLCSFLSMKSRAEFQTTTSDQCARAPTTSCSERH